MCHGEFVPATVAPHPVHGVGDFQHGNVLIKPKVFVIGSARFRLFVIPVQAVVEVFHVAADEGKRAFQQFQGPFSGQVFDQVFDGRFAVVEGDKIKKLEHPRLGK